MAWTSSKSTMRSFGTPASAAFSAFALPRLTPNRTFVFLAMSFAAGDRGTELMGDEVQRIVVGCDGSDDAERFAREPALPLDLRKSNTSQMTVQFHNKAYLIF